MKVGPLRLERASLAADGMRFLVAGGLNTLLTLVVYQMLLFMTPPNVAYAISWLVGILFVMIVYPSRVFTEGRAGIVDRILLGCSYATVFFLGLLFLQLLNSAKVPPRLSIIPVMGFTTVASFVAGRFLLRRQ